MLRLVPITKAEAEQRKRQDRIADYLYDLVTKTAEEMGVKMKGAGTGAVGEGAEKPNKPDRSGADEIKVFEKTLAG